MSPYVPYLISLSCLLLAATFARALLSKSRFPPGPTPLPFIGNLLDVPRVEYHKYYARWKKLYGGISYLRIFGRQFVLLNEAQDAIDLFEKRSGIYSSRPHLVMAGSLVGRQKTALFLPYGKRFKETRRLMHTFMNARAAENHWHVQEMETSKFLLRLLHTPEQFMEHIKSTQAAVILKLAYGYQIDYQDDHFVYLAEAIAKITTEATEPGYWLVDSFPILQHIPSWFPGAGFKKWAEQARTNCETFTRAPFEFVKTSLRSGSVVPSFTSANLTDVSDQDAEAEEIVMYAAASLYSGGSDTTVSVIKLLFLMLSIHPDIQVRAQQEIDLVVGNDRLPDMSDRNSLPYIQCIIQELHRTSPVVPLVPHSPVEDDTYKGFLIPKGAWVMANIWAMTHDPLVYPDPFVFNPSRFEKSAEAISGVLQPDPTKLVFGFGRRACPGQSFAEASLFLSVSRVLWAFNINCETDSNGNPIVPEVAFTTGHTVHPKPFTCRVSPRSAERAALLEEIADNVYSSTCV